MRSLQLFIDSLQVRFLHIRKYELQGDWRGEDAALSNNVLWYVEEGSFSIQIDQWKATAKPGCFFLLPAGASISYRAISERIRLISVNFAAYIEFMPDRRWSELLGLPYGIEPHRSSTLSHLVREMHNVSQTKALTLNLNLQAGLQHVMAELIECSALVPPDQLPVTYDTRLLTVMNYVVTHMDELPTVTRMSELVDVSESHLRKLFRDQFGVSPSDFLRQMKVEQAKRLLRMSDLRVAEVAMRLGYEDANYFARLFHSYAECSPSDYRKQFRM